MIVSERLLRWALCLYPPFLFQRISIRKFHKDFRAIDMKIAKSLFNNNYNGSIFGGTIYCATDPVYALLFDQALQRKGFKVRVWLKSASIQYLKPARSNLYFTVYLTDEMLDEAVHALNTIGKFVKAYPIEITNKEGELCATVTNEVYVRSLHTGERASIAY
jgi:acyl-coenzyme A thioesterase PaaI-like protein